MRRFSFRRPAPGPVPAVIVVLANTGEKPLNEYRAAAVFRSRWDERGVRTDARDVVVRR